MKTFISKKDLGILWNDAHSIEGKSPNLWRKDFAGAWIRYDQYGKRTPYGWEVCHIKPLSKGGNDSLENLIPIHWRNSRYKGEDYPKCRTCISSEGNKNISKIRTWNID